MVLARHLARRTPALASYARCACCSNFKGFSSEHTNSEELAERSSQAEEDSPSTSGQGVGWLRGPEANKPNKSIEEEWMEVRDPESGTVAWRSILTGETTVPGAPKPDTWVEVVDKKTGLLYYWCKRTGHTTVLGEPKPGPYGRKLQLDMDEEGVAIEDGASRGGKEGGGPSLIRLVKNPLVIGVSLMALAGIAYDNFFR